MRLASFVWLTLLTSYRKDMELRHLLMLLLQHWTVLPKLPSSKGIMSQVTRPRSLCVVPPHALLLEPLPFLLLFRWMTAGTLSSCPPFCTRFRNPCWKKTSQYESKNQSRWSWLCNTRIKYCQVIDINISNQDRREKEEVQDTPGLSLSHIKLPSDRKRTSSVIKPIWRL